MKRYSVRSIFDTLQGEGARAGSRAVFVRLAGCNVWDGLPEHRDRGIAACARWCDTDFATGEPMTAGEIRAAADRLWGDAVSERWVVLTGGEPLLQADEELATALRAGAWSIAVETNGSVRPRFAPDWLTVSPKKGAAVVLERAHELKVVLPGVAGAEEGWSDDELVDLACVLSPTYCFVQPQDPIDARHVERTFLHGDVDARATYESHVRRCVAFVVGHPTWRLSVQQHKLVGLP